MKTYEFLLLPDGRKGQDGKSEVYLCLKRRTLKKCYATSVTVYFREWDQVAQRVIADESSGLTNHYCENRKLVEIEAQVDGIISTLQDKDPNWHFVHFDSIFIRKIRIVNAYDYFLYQIEKATQQNDTPLAIKLKKTLSMLFRFENRFETKRFDFISRLFLYGWNEWMREWKESDDERLEYIYTLGLCMYNAERDGMLPKNKNPYRGTETEPELSPEHFKLEMRDM